MFRIRFVNYCATWKRLDSLIVEEKGVTGILNIRPAFA